jgi:hypothetical protein
MLARGQSGRSVILCPQIYRPNCDSNSPSHSIVRCAKLTDSRLLPSLFSMLVAINQHHGFPNDSQRDRTHGTAL